MEGRAAGAKAPMGREWENTDGCAGVQLGLLGACWLLARLARPCGGLRPPPCSSHWAPPAPPPPPLSATACVRAHLVSSWLHAFPEVRPLGIVSRGFTVGTTCLLKTVHASPQAPASMSPSGEPPPDRGAWSHPLPRLFPIMLLHFHFSASLLDSHRAFSLEAWGDPGQSQQPPAPEPGRAVWHAHQEVLSCRGDCGGGRGGRPWGGVGPCGPWPRPPQLSPALQLFPAHRTPPPVLLSPQHPHDAVRALRAAEQDWLPHGPRAGPARGHHEPDRRDAAAGGAADDGETHAGGGPVLPVRPQGGQSFGGGREGSCGPSGRDWVSPVHGGKRTPGLRGSAVSPDAPGPHTPVLRSL